VIQAKTSMSMSSWSATSPDAPQLFPLGHTHGYSAALRYAVLARIMEVVDGKPWDTIMKDRLFDPLELTSTSSFHEQVDQDTAGARVHRKHAPAARLSAADSPSGPRHERIASGATSPRAAKQPCLAWVLTVRLSLADTGGHAIRASEVAAPGAEEPRRRRRSWRRALPQRDKTSSRLLAARLELSSSSAGMSSITNHPRAAEPTITRLAQRLVLADRLCGPLRADRASYTRHLHPRGHKPIVPMIALADQHLLSRARRPRLMTFTTAVSARRFGLSWKPYPQTFFKRKSRPRSDLASPLGDGSSSSTGAVSGWFKDLDGDRR
jgi:Beta-lactamase